MRRVRSLWLLRLSLGIQLAPAFVACSAWLTINNGQVDVLTKMLFGYGLLQMLFSIRLLPWYRKGPFNASFWSFSFGLSALANTALHSCCRRPNTVFFAQIVITLARFVLNLSKTV